MMATANTAKQRLQFEAIGTWWTIDIFSNIGQRALTTTASSISSRIETYDRHYSRFRDDSLISRMARQPGSYTLPEDAKPLFDIYQQLYHLTNGSMTPLIGNLMSDAGYDADYSLRPGELRPVPAWEEVLEYRYPLLDIKQPAILDLGAAGKGYLIDIIAALLEESGIAAYCIDAGGDILQRGLSADDDRIGLEHPAQVGTVIGIASIGNGSLCGSAGNRRAWAAGAASDGGSLHHIMDPHTLTPVRQIAGLWVWAPTALIADALATALFFIDPTSLRRSFQFEYAILYDSASDVAVHYSSGFPADFFKNK